METLISKKVVFNPLSKVVMTTSIIPVCDYWNESNDAPIEQRHSMVESHADEIIANGGEIQVADNGDIYVTRQVEDLYDNSPEDAQTVKDWYFMNMSFSERDIMSDYEYFWHCERTAQSILRRYLSEEDRNLIYTNPEEYMKKIKKVSDETATVIQSIEATVDDWLKKAFKTDTSLINSDLIQSVFKTIKIRQLSISCFTDIRTQMYGVAKNFYPFVYFKSGKIYDMCKTLSKAPQKLTQIDLSPYNPSNMSIYYKQIQSNKKNLMTICKWTNTNTYVIPEGWMKGYIYNDPVNKKIIGDLDSIFEGLNIEIIRHGTYTEYNVSINNSIATNKLDELYRKYVEDKYGMVLMVGTKAQKDTTSQSIFLNDYGITIPKCQLSVQHQNVLKFEEGEKFVVYFCFMKQNDKSTNLPMTEDQYYTQMEKSSGLRYIGTSRVWTSKNYQEKQSMSFWPLANSNDFSDDIKEVQKEMWYKQEFEYDETSINDHYTKGDFWYMTKTKQKTSAGFIGITCKTYMDLPYSASYDKASGAPPVYSTKRKDFILRSVISIHDMNDVYQIKDSINNARFDMLSKLYSIIDMWLKKDFEITGTPLEQIDTKYKELIYHNGLRKCLVDVDYHTKKVLLNEILPKKEKALYAIFPKTFNITEEKIEYLSDFHDIAESSYVYELKTFAMARRHNQSYTTNNRIQFVPTPMPFNIRDIGASKEVIINFNALVPSITSEYEIGGGMIAKKEYRVLEDVYLKYIISKSKDFRSGLSNSEIVRFEIDTFNSEGLDVLYQNVFPTKRKDIGLVFKRMTSGVEDASWRSVFIKNNLITNLIYEHNFLSQTDTIQMQLTIYDKDK